MPSTINAIEPTDPEVVYVPTYNPTVVYGAWPYPAYPPYYWYPPDYVAGGALDYVVRGRAIGGFGVVALPGEYGVSGIMTFTVNQGGKICQADLGRETAARASGIRRFDPGTGLVVGRIEVGRTRTGERAMARDKRSKKAKKEEGNGKQRDRAGDRSSNGNGDADAAAEGLSNKEYLKILKGLHVELVQLQEWAKASGAKVCVIFEGRDGAGKGGTIKAITERVSPRVFRVVALPAPTEREKSQMYLQRYIRHLPAAGEIVIFDRSWYNRAGVERVMGFATDEQVKRFLALTPLVEKAIVESGIILLKYWLEVSPDEQTRRLEARITDGRKIWKLSPMDLKSYSRWFDYSRARDDMLRATDTAWAPWYVVRSDDKKCARLNLITHLLGKIPYQAMPREKITLPKRQKQGDYRETDYPFKFVPEKH